MFQMKNNFICEIVGDIISNFIIAVLILFLLCTFIFLDEYKSILYFNIRHIYLFIWILKTEG